MHRQDTIKCPFEYIMQHDDHMSKSILNNYQNK